MLPFLGCKRMRGSGSRLKDQKAKVEASLRRKREMAAYEPRNRNPWRSPGSRSCAEDPSFCSELDPAKGPSYSAFTPLELTGVPSSKGAP